MKKIRYDGNNVHKIISKYFEKSWEKKKLDEKYNSKLIFDMIVALHAENVISRIAIETLKDIILKKKIATKKEIDDTIDKIAFKKMKEYKIK